MTLGVARRNLFPLLDVANIGKKGGIYASKKNISENLLSVEARFSTHYYHRHPIVSLNLSHSLRVLVSLI